MAKSFRKRITNFKFETWFKILFIVAAIAMVLSACSVRQAQKTLLNAEGVKPTTFCHGLKLTATDGQRLAPCEPAPSA